MGAMRAATAGRSVLLGIDALKQPMIGWLLNQAFGRLDWITDPMGDYPEMTVRAARWMSATCSTTTAGRS